MCTLCLSHFHIFFLYFSGVGGWTPLHEAVDNNNLEIVKMLLEHQDIDVNKKDGK